MSEEMSNENTINAINDFLGVASETKGIEDDAKSDGHSDHYMSTQIHERVKLLQLFDNLHDLCSKRIFDFEIETIVDCIIDNGILTKVIDNFIQSVKKSNNTPIANTMTTNQEIELINENNHLKNGKYCCQSKCENCYNEYLQSTFLECLTDISASTNENHIMLLTKSQIIENIKHLLLLPMTDENIEIMINIVWTTGNIAGTSTECADYILSSCNIFPNFIQLKEKCCEILTKDKIDKKKEMIKLLDTMAWTLYNCIKGMPDEAPYGLSFLLSCIEYLTSLMKAVECDDDITSISLWALIRITESQTAQRQNISIFDKMKQCDTIQWLVNGLTNQCDKTQLQSNCIRLMDTITRLIITRKEEVLYVVNCGLFKQLFQTLYQLNENLCQWNFQSMYNCLKVINNIIVKINDCDVIFESGLMPTIVEFMNRGLSYGENDEIPNESLCEVNSNVNRNNKNVETIKPLSILNSQLDLLITGFIRMNLNHIEYGKKVSPNDISSVAMNCFDTSEDGFEKFYPIRQISCDILCNIMCRQASLENWSYLVKECNIRKTFGILFNLSKIDLKNEEMKKSHRNLINKIGTAVHQMWKTHQIQLQSITNLQIGK